MPRRPDLPLTAALLAVGLAAVLSVTADDDAATAGGGPSSSSAAPTATGAAAPAAGTASSGGATATTSTRAAGASAGAGSRAYEDGTYEASGTYQSPAGKETVSVSLTVAGDRVTKVRVTPGAQGGPSEQFQTAFADGIAKVVVGRELRTLAVDVVAGSSLTGGGFDAAVERIRAEAAVT